MSRRFEPKVPKLVGTRCPPARFLAQGGPCRAHPSLPKRQMQGAGRPWEGEQSRCISSPGQGACVCVGGRGAWVCGCIYCLFPPAPAPCAHTGGRDPRAQPTAPWTFTLLCKQAGARLGYQLEFHLVNSTRSLSGQALEHLPSVPAPQLPAGHPALQVSLGDAHFTPTRTLFPSPLLSAGSSLQTTAMPSAAITPPPAKAGPHCCSPRGNGKMGH